MGVMNYLKLAFKFFIFKVVRTYEEKTTDKLTIKKGYAKQLYELSIIKRQDQKHEKIDKFYLSLDEIKSYAKEIGKW